MNTMALVVAGAAALAIVLIAFALASSRGSSIGDRLERYASTNTIDPRKIGASGQGGVAELIAQSEALNSLNRVVERSEEHTSELSHANISYAVFCLKK